MSQTTPRPDTSGKLPVFKTVAGAYRSVATRFGSVIEAAAVPYILSVVVTGIAVLAVQNQNGALGGAIMFLNLAPYVLAGVAWYRLTLLGPVAGAPSLLQRWTRRHWRFLGYAVAVLLVSYGIAITPVLVALAVIQDSTEPNLVLSLLVFPVIVINSYLIVRLSFVFPATAVDERYGLRESWLHTKRQGFRLLGTVVLTIVPMAALLWTVFLLSTFYLFAEIGGGTGQKGIPRARMEAFVEENSVILLIGLLVYTAFNYLLMALIVSALSSAFRTCTGWVPAAGGAPVARGEEDA